MSSASPHSSSLRDIRHDEELTSTLSSAIQSIPSDSFKANILLETAVSLIQQGKYGDQVEKYLEVYLRTPNLTRQEVARALIVRGNARKAQGGDLVEKAMQDFQAVATMDPSNLAIEIKSEWPQ